MNVSHVTGAAERFRRALWKKINIRMSLKIAQNPSNRAPHSFKKALYSLKKALYY